MRTDNFNFTLPESQVAQYPADRRGASRMLVLDRVTGECEVKMFSDLPDYLSAGDCAVFNNTKVMNARMYGTKPETGGKVELLLVSHTYNKQSEWKALIKPGKRVRPGTRIKLTSKDESLDSDDWLTVEEHRDDGSFTVVFDSDKIWDLQDKYGHIPLPPYIKRGDETSDFERYQTIFAQNPGAVAAPTAGLHFNEQTMKDLAEIGVNKTEVTLHVGPGTFKPVSVDNVEEHEMHTEQFFLPTDAETVINKTHANGNKVLAVGTTTVRVLESCAGDDGNVLAGNGDTNIFIYPPYKPKAVDMLLTNFHLPKSTLLMLVSAFSDRDKIMAAYERAINEGFMFYSYGDCMLIK